MQGIGYPGVFGYACICKIDGISTGEKVDIFHQCAMANGLEDFRFFLMRFTVAGKDNFPRSIRLAPEWRLANFSQTPDPKLQTLNSVCHVPPGKLVCTFIFSL